MIKIDKSIYLLHKLLSLSISVLRQFRQVYVYPVVFVCYVKQGSEYRTSKYRVNLALKGVKLKFLKDKLWSMDEKSLWEYYNQLWQEKSFTIAKEVNKVLHTKQQLIKLTEEAYKTKKYKHFEKVFGDFKCSGDCEKCHHKKMATHRLFGEFIDSLSEWKVFYTQTFNTGRITARYKEIGQKWNMIGEQFCTDGFYDVVEMIESTLISRGVYDKLFQLDYVAGLEQQKRGDYHIHALLNADISELADIIKWKMYADDKYGLSHWRLYQKDKGASIYMCKYLVKGNSMLMRVKGSDNRTVDFNIISPSLIPDDLGSRTDV